MYEVTINRWETREDGTRRHFEETHVYYESVEEADKNGIKYVKDWRAAFVLNELAKGDHIVTNEGHVIPVTGISYTNFKLVRTPNGTFNPKHPFLTSKLFKNRYSLSPTSEQSSSSNQKTRKKRDQKDSRFLLRGAWYLVRFGDPVMAYKFAYSDRPWLSKMSESSIKLHATSMCRRERFARLFMTEMSKHFKEADIRPADLLKNIQKRTESKKESFANVLRGTQFLLALHPDFLEQVMPMVVKDSKIIKQLPGNNLEEAEFELIEEGGVVEPGKYTTKKDENGETKAVDGVVSESLPSESVLAEEAGGDS